MPKCPKCGADIAALILVETKEREYNVTYDEESEELGFEETEEWRGNPTGTVIKQEWNCGVCKKVIFDNEGDAKAFLSDLRVKVIKQLHEELGREPTESEIQTSLKSIDEHMG